MCIGATTYVGPVGRVPANFCDWLSFCWGQRFVTDGKRTSSTVSYDKIYTNQKTMSGEDSPGQSGILLRFRKLRYWIKEGKCMEGMGKTGADVRRGGRLEEEKEGNRHPLYVKSPPTFQRRLRLCECTFLTSLYTAQGLDKVTRALARPLNSVFLLC